MQRKSRKLSRPRRPRLGLETREERVRELEADREALIASYAEVVPEVLDALSGEERMRVYEMLQLEVMPDPEGYEVSEAFCSSRPRGRSRFDGTKRTQLCFRALLTGSDARILGTSSRGRSRKSVARYRLGSTRNGRYSRLCWHCACSFSCACRKNLLERSSLRS